MFTLNDEKPILDIIHEYSDKENRPLVIDNGSFKCRAGWAVSEQPELVFKSFMAKNRANRKERDWDLLVGNEIQDIEALRWMIRSPFDFNVVVNFSVQETLFDYAFQHLGINTADCVDHPVVMTEPIANPSYCRKNMNELLFEGYSIPKVAYGIDCMFSHLHNFPISDEHQASLIIDSGFQGTHILPVVDGIPDVKNSLRLNLGGYNCCAYLQWILQYKHPQYASELTLTRMETIVHKFCNVVNVYSEAVSKWSDPVFAADNSTQIKFQSRGNTTLKPSNTNTIPIKLEKKFKQAEYKLFEVESVIEIEQDNIEGARKAANDLGCKDVEELKDYAKELQENVDAIQEDLDAQYKSDTTSSQQPCTLELGIEKIQVPEILFQPSMVGYEQCGLSECVDHVLEKYPDDVQEKMAANVFLTGGNTKLIGLADRITHDLIQIRPFRSKVQVKTAQCPSLDGWKGASDWAKDSNNQKYFVSKQEYEENGSEYFKEHKCSNRIGKAKIEE